MKKKFDSKTAMKIISDYAEKINNYIKENQNLKSQLDDTKTTLMINKELLYKYIGQQTKNMERMDLLNELRNENKRLTELTNNLYKEKTTLEKKLYKIQQDIEDKVLADKEVVERSKELIFLFENKIVEKENTIQHLRSELENYYRNNEGTPREIILADPDKVNLELYNELNMSRELIAKMTRKLNIEQKQKLSLEAKVKEFEEKLINFKKGKKISKNMENIALFGYISSSDGEIDDESDNRSMMNLESPVVIFPEKIKMKKPIVSLNNTVSNMQMSIPKLDLSIVKAKYHAPKNVEIAEVIAKKSNRSSNEYIEKLKFQLKVCKNTVNNMKKKIEKYKRIFQVQKQTLINLKNKNELLEMQLKKSTTGGSTYDEANSNSVNKKEMNTSMNANTSVRFEEFDENEFEEDFNEVIKNFNKTVSQTDYK